METHRGVYTELIVSVRKVCFICKVQQFCNGTCLIKIKCYIAATLNVAHLFYLNIISSLLHEHIGAFLSS